jgi:hypothetical protein
MTEPNSDHLTSASSEGEPSEELAACPFCGKAMKPRHALHVSDGNTDSIIHAESSECGMSSFDIGTIDFGVSVAAAWNRRAPAVPPNWKLVPVEPTDAMLKAAAQTPGIKFLDETSSITQLRRPSDYEGVFVGEGSPLQQAWGAMLAASPVSLTKGAAGEVQCGICQAIKVMGAGCDRDDCPCSERMCGHG